MTHILVVEDETSLRQLLTQNLSYEGYSVAAAADGGEALSSHHARRADLIVLDLMLPVVDGFQVLRMLREHQYPVPVLMLTATREEQIMDLTPREFRLLEILITHAGRTHSRSELLQLAWEQDAQPTPRTVDVHIANLRKKLGDDGGKPYIATVGGEGYRWVLPV